VNITLDFHQIFTYFCFMILVGTSGFQYREWVPVFYPRSLDPDSWLSFYSRQFDCCELGLTYYRIPEVFTIQEIIEQTRGTVQFVFRAPYRFSEEHSDNSELARRFCATLWPLKDSGQLAGVLAQFPPEFGFFRENFERLCRIRDCLEGIPLITEFGCTDWLSPRAAKHLASARIALACVDGGTTLKERAFFYATAGLAYIRFGTKPVQVDQRRRSASTLSLQPGGACGCDSGNPPAGAGERAGSGLYEQSLARPGRYQCPHVVGTIERNYELRMTNYELKPGRVFYSSFVIRHP
jgi:uncharacterized protein YecE (DUF72 family)